MGGYMANPIAFLFIRKDSPTCLGEICVGARLLPSVAIDLGHGT